MEKMLGLIGFGEAGRTFAIAGGWSGARVYDRLTDDMESRDAKQAEYADAGVAGCDSLAETVRGAAMIISLVTADEALAVARDVAALIAPGTLYCDLNSVAPDTKRAGAELIDATGAHYVDVAVMAPVDPARLSVPLLVSGTKAGTAKANLAALGFTKVEIVGHEIGRASSIKMIRSVMVKGIEALTAECALAAAAAGVSDEVLASLDASDKPKPWDERADYNLDRMMIHGLRRAAEMEEVVKTLDALGTGSTMTRGTVERQRAIGELGLIRPARGLPAKIDQINANMTGDRTNLRRIGAA
jgi:3-hydroxyisobutyrate dehydrogenase-like beta-hydroxyacid dehydrogenase